MGNSCILDMGNMYSEFSIPSQGDPLLGSIDLGLYMTFIKGNCFDVAISESILLTEDIYYVFATNDSDLNLTTSDITVKLIDSTTNKVSI